MRRYLYPCSLQKVGPISIAPNHCMLPMMAFVNSEVLELPPKSPVRYFPSAMVPSTALCTPATHGCLSMTI